MEMGDTEMVYYRVQGLHRGGWRLEMGKTEETQRSRKWSHKERGQPPEKSYSGQPSKNIYSLFYFIFVCVVSSRVCSLRSLSIFFLSCSSFPRSVISMFCSSSA